MTALPRVAELPAGDPRKGWWTYADLAAAFGRSVGVVKDDMADWRRRGFPAPLPWSRRERRWHPEAVLAWKRREEQRHGAAARPELRIEQGGRHG